MKTKTYNIKLLTENELNSFKDKYLIEKLDDDRLIVSCKNYERTTVHSTHKTFFLATNGRKINITENVITLWMNYFQNYHLVEIQNYANMLYLMYKNPTQDDILKLINKK